jgi:hypothetical protein
MVAQFEHAAHCLLAHFRVVLIGFAPFEIARRNISELVEREELDSPAVAYIQDVTRIIEEDCKSFQYLPWLVLNSQFPQGLPRSKVTNRAQLMVARHLTTADGSDNCSRSSGLRGDNDYWCPNLTLFVVIAEFCPALSNQEGAHLPQRLVTLGLGKLQSHPAARWMVA